MTKILIRQNCRLIVSRKKNINLHNKGERQEQWNFFPSPIDGLPTMADASPQINSKNDPLSVLHAHLDRR